MVTLSSKSKRTTLKMKYKIEKKVKQHHKKMRKLSRSDVARRKYRSDVHIPNSCPFKAEMLKQIIENKKKHKEEVQEKRDQRRNAKIDCTGGSK